MKKIVSLIVLAVVVSTGYWLFVRKDGAHKAPVAESTQQKIMVVNVLDKVDYDDARIKGSVHVPFEDVEKHAATWNKEVPVVVYCSNYMCMASGAAAEQLTALGFKDVYAYEGGMAEWYQLSKNAPEYAVEGPAQAEYLSIVVPKPAHANKKFKNIDAQELQKMMKDANLL